MATLEMRSLANKTILIGRPRFQSEYLMEQVGARAGRAVLCPGLDVQELPIDPVSPLDECDVIVFVSPTSVEMGWKNVSELLKVQPSIQIAAVGRSTADKLNAKGRLVFAPEGQGGADSLVKVMRGNLDLSLSTVLVVTAEGGSGRLEHLLEHEGATVKTHACYHRSDIQDPIDTEVLAQLKAGLDGWIVTSRRSIGNIFVQFKGREALLTSAPLFVNHSAVAEKALALGVTTVFVCQDAGVAMMHSLEDWFSSLDLRQ